MKPPYKADPTPVYEVPFDNPDLVAKANKNGTIIVNKDRVRDKKLMDEAMSHEKQHLKDMQDGKLDYDNLSVTFKGKRYGRDSFDEGNENLPWEKRAYAAGRNRKKIDLTPKKKKLTGPPAMSDGKPLLVDNTSSPFQALDENEVNMNESFGPSLELDEIASQLDKAVVAHGKQAEGIRDHIKEMKDMQKGSALHSPIKMWGAPAFEEGKDTDPSGEGEDEKTKKQKAQEAAEANLAKMEYKSETLPDGTVRYFKEATGEAGGEGSVVPGSKAKVVPPSKRTTDPKGYIQSLLDDGKTREEVIAGSLVSSSYYDLFPSSKETATAKDEYFVPPTNDDTEEEITFTTTEIPGTPPDTPGSPGGGGGKNRGKRKKGKGKNIKQKLETTKDTGECRVDDKRPFCLANMFDGGGEKKRKRKVVKKKKKAAKKLFRNRGLY